MILATCEIQSPTDESVGLFDMIIADEFFLLIDVLFQDSYQ